MERFFDFFDVNLTELKNLRVVFALINLILEWSLNLSSIFRIGPCSDESVYLYPLLDIFKIGRLIKYSLNFLTIWPSRETILSSSTKLILEYFITFSDRSGLTVFQNALLSITTLVSRLLSKFVFSFLGKLTT